MASFGGTSANSSGSSVVSTGTVPAGSPSGTREHSPSPTCPLPTGRAIDLSNTASELLANGSFPGLPQPLLSANSNAIAEGMKQSRFGRLLRMAHQ